MNISKYYFDDNKTHIMGILNLTPDSFYDGGKNDLYLNKVEQMINDGADIIDVGGESTRPGSAIISEEEEIDRIISPIIDIKKHFNIPISVDTYKSVTAKRALEVGADIINDIGNLSSDMANVISNSKAFYVLTHNKHLKCDRNKSYYTMDKLIVDMNNDLVRLREYGIDERRVIIDPGIGFGKSNKDDIMILGKINELKDFDLPILVGASNKSCIDYVFPCDVNDRLEGTLAISAHAFYNHINFIRVHNVKENKKLLTMLEQIN